MSFNNPSTPSRRFFVLLSILGLVVLGACDKKKSKEGRNGIKASSVDPHPMPDVPVPPVVLPLRFPDASAPRAYDAEAVVLTADADELDEDVLLNKRALDRMPVLPKGVKARLKEQSTRTDRMQVKARRIVRDAEEIKALLEQKKKKLGKEGYRKWKASRRDVMIKKNL